MKLRLRVVVTFVEYAGSSVQCVSCSMAHFLSGGCRATQECVGRVHSCWAMHRLSVSHCDSQCHGGGYARGRRARGRTWHEAFVRDVSAQRKDGSWCDMARSLAVLVGVVEAKVLRSQAPVHLWRELSEIAA